MKGADVGLLGTALVSIAFVVALDALSGVFSFGYHPGTANVRLLGITGLVAVNGVVLLVVAEEVDDAD